MDHGMFSNLKLGDEISATNNDYVYFTTLTLIKTAFFVDIIPIELFYKQ